MRVTNEEIRIRAGVESISKQVTTRRWTWLGHHLYPRIAHTWVTEGRRNQGRPQETVQREVREKGLKSWAEKVSAVEDKTTWKQRDDNPILH